MGLGILLVPLNQYCFLKGLELSVPRHSALFYAITTNAQPPVTTLLAAATAAMGLLPGDQDLGTLFFLGMALSVAGVIMIQKAKH